MTLDITKSLEIIEEMENYINFVRPRPEIRHQFDIGYELQGQSVILNEIRPSFKNPSTIESYGYAKAAFVKNKNIWKIYWLRSDLKWHAYPPKTSVKQLRDFLKIVHEDKYHCFKG